MTTTLYIVKGQDGALITGTFENLADAVLAAAGSDGWGAEYARDENGAMRLYSSRGRIGNNDYFRRDSDAFYPESKLSDDAAAIDDLASQVVARGALHSKHKLTLVALIVDAKGIVSHIDGQTVEDISAETETSVADVRAYYCR